MVNPRGLMKFREKSAIAFCPIVNRLAAILKNGGFGRHVSCVEHKIFDISASGSPISVLFEFLYT